MKCHKRGIICGKVVFNVKFLGTKDGRLWVLFGFFWQEANHSFAGMGREILLKTVFKPYKKGFGLFNMFSFCAIRCLMVITDNSS